MRILLVAARYFVLGLAPILLSEFLIDEPTNIKFDKEGSYTTLIATENVSIQLKRYITSSLDKLKGTVS